MAVVAGKEAFDVANGRMVNVHPRSACEGRHCCVHSPSDHHMRDWPQVWRPDRGLMERMCPHGIGHVDPDHISWVRENRGEKAAQVESVHGCDGCCHPPGGETIEGTTDE